VLQESFDPMKRPAQIVSPETFWYVDRAAAAKL
jgi:hypothetical protein